ncbi:MAG: DUF3140 domain-containing protein [Bacteroidota bacterium]
MDQEKKATVYDDFYNNVNMTPSEIEDWLETEKSKSVGQDLNSRCTVKPSI